MRMNGIIKSLIVPLYFDDWIFIATVMIMGVQRY